jgi:antitoxin VapB
MVMKIAKVFKHGNSQAIRLPKEFRFDADEVVVKRTASGVLLMPKKITLAQLDAVLGQFRGRFVRRQPAPQKRRWR